MSDTPQVATAQDVGAFRDHPWIVKLPRSELAVQVRRLSLMECVAQGRIPDELATSAIAGLAEALEEAREKGSVQARAAVRRHVELVDAVACALLVKPRMSRERGDPDAIAPEDLPWADRVHLYELAVGTEEGPNLSPFPGRPGADLASVSDGAGVRDQAVVAPGGS